MGDYDMSIHGNPDAGAWAKFFMETAKKNGWTIPDIDEGLMLGWFANAMCAAQDVAVKEGERRIAAMESRATIAESLVIELLAALRGVLPLTADGAEVSVKEFAARVAAAHLAVAHAGRKS